MNDIIGVRSQESGTIYVLLSGRLGNQFFQYASARGLQAKFFHNYNIVVNIHGFQTLSEQQKMDQGWENSLVHFQLKNVEYINVHSRKIKTLPQKIILKIRYMLYTRMDKLGLIKAKHLIDRKLVQPICNVLGIYTPLSASSPAKRPLCTHPRNILYSAYSWNRRDFDDIRDSLLEEFTPVHDVLPHNQLLMKDIQESESVCVTIRRGDFLSTENRNKFNVCNEEYFVTAMKAIREELPNCKFFVFSDDVEDVKRNMHFPFDVTYERGNDPVWEKLRLMYSCKHFIISNSTFSWWAQYLSRNPHKIVYAPIPWLWGGGNGENIYPDNVRTIECHK